MRTKPHDLWSWAVAGVVGTGALLWGHPRVFPYQPNNWQLSRSEATAIALERLRQLGEPVVDPYVVTHWQTKPLIERRLQSAESVVPVATLRASPLAKQVTTWEVVVYPAGARASEWAYRARLALAGEVLALRRRVPIVEAGAPLAAAAARARADGWLTDQGYHLADFAEPELRMQQQTVPADTSVRYRYRQQVLGEEAPYGVEVTFAGDRLTGFLPYFDDPNAGRLALEIQPLAGLGWARSLTTFLLLLATTVPFLRRYSAGEIGVRRGLQLSGVVVALGALLMMTSAGPGSEGISFGPLSRALASWVYATEILLVYVLPLGLLVFIFWSVGESQCREIRCGKLAAFDAVCQGQWTNATVARGALIGTGAGLALPGFLFVASVFLAPAGVRTLYTLNVGPWWSDSSWLGLGLLTFAAILALPGELFARLTLVPWFDRRLGRWPGGMLAAVVGGLACWHGPLAPLPIGWSVLAAVGAAGFSVALFRRYDLLATLVCAFVSGVVVSAIPLATAADPSVQFQGCLALLGAGLPLLATVRHLASEDEVETRERTTGRS